MDLRTAYPFWLIDKGLRTSYPSLDHDITTEVAIVGAGISGALVAWQLGKAGIKCVIVDRRHVGMGSTAATTGLLQYETDTPLHELIAKVGYQNACSSYLLSSKAIDELEKLTHHFPEAEFARRPSLQYASFKKDVNGLKQEYDLRKSIGLELDWLEASDVDKKFGFKKPAAVFSKQGAIVNAYGLAHALLAKSPGLKVYDRTEVTRIVHQKKHIELHTTDKFHIRARKVVVACGYESGKYLPKRVDQLHTTYALVSQPFAEKTLWHHDALIWETAEPYLYFRTTLDNRIMLGGKDDDFTSPLLRAAALPRKTRQLEKAFSDLFPAIPLKTDFYWAGSFASTKDGLPYIGALPGRKDVYFALGFGGNGIVFSQLAATIIRDLITGKSSKSAAIFNFNR